MTPRYHRACAAGGGGYQAGRARGRRGRAHDEGAGPGADTTTTGFTMVVADRYCALTVSGATLPFTICVSTILCVRVCVCNKCAAGCDTTSGVNPFTTTLPSVVVDTGVGETNPFSLVNVDILLSTVVVVTPLV